MAELQTLVDGLRFPEGPRWRHGALWCSDMHDRRVLRIDETGATTTVVEVPGQPSGLGWLPDGTLVVVSMLDRRVLRVGDAGALELHADLAPLTPWTCNDMVVDAHGRAYVGNFGFDLYAGAPPRATNLLAVDPGGRAWEAADALEFPNGCVVTPDGSTLIVGESWGARLTAFSIAPDGTLYDRRVFADLRPLGAMADGICLDAEGAVWVACPLSSRCVRVAEGGTLLDEVATGRLTFACTLGGADGRTLFVCTASTHEPDRTATARDGRIEAVHVEVPGAGSP
jgi:sugar lactone lactonase YvrE